jgi:hypothetical protein
MDAQAQGGGHGQSAISVRDCVERCLTDPVRSWHVATDTYSWIAPVEDRFHLERVELREDLDTSIVDIYFRWDEGLELFGISYAIPDQGPGMDAPDAFISIYVQEDLLAYGRGVENARRVQEGGVAWLDWRGSSCLRH